MEKEIEGLLFINKLQPTKIQQFRHNNIMLTHTQGYRSLAFFKHCRKYYRGLRFICGNSYY